MRALIAAGALLATMAVTLPAVASSAGASTGTTCRPVGADPTGGVDSTQAIRDAIAVCGASTGPAPYTVVIAAGTYKLNLADCAKEDLQLNGRNPVALVGAGRATTTLVEWVGLSDPTPVLCNGVALVKSLLALRTDGSSVQDIKLDTLTYNAGSAIHDDANNTTVSRVWATHGNVKASPPIFTIHYAGGVGSDRSHNCTTGPGTYCHSGNVVDDLILYDEMCDDGFSFAFQTNATISNLKYQGSRLAIYVVNGLTINGFNYSPGVQPCKAKQGFWVTSPSANIAINDYRTSAGNAKADANWSAPAVAAGGGGVVGTSQGGSTYQSNNVRLNGYRQTGNFANELVVANVVTGFTLGPGLAQPCSFGNNNVLRLAPQVSLSAVTVTGCSLAATKISAAPGVSITGLLYVNDTFTRQTAQSYSWTDGSRTVVLVTLSDGIYSNCYTLPNKLKYQTSDLVNLTFASAVGALFPTNWTCP
jgi:hypothetical protein